MLQKRKQLQTELTIENLAKGGGNGKHGNLACKSVSENIPVRIKQKGFTRNEPPGEMSL